MLGLTLREEFRDRRLKGTAIELANEKNTGATQVEAAAFLEITYPTADLLRAIEALGPGQGRSIVLLGERGQGKSHLLAAMFHALTSAESTKTWLEHWSARLSNTRIANLPLRSGMHVVSESLHRQRQKFLWDLLFERHPRGQYYRGRWESLGERKTDVPSDALLLDMLREQPTALLLDEFQTWFDGLTNTKQYPWKNWAFNFVQLLSEIAREHPELLVLVVTVRNGNTDAYQQIHRVNPVQIDFKGPHAERDRRRLLLHRLFVNRAHIPETDIASLIAVHIEHYLRLGGVPSSEHERKRRDFIETWPFAPHLMQLLEDQVLVATDAQETRDLIRILADLWKSRSASAPILTAADFRLDDDQSGIVALLDSVANQHHASLREKAQRNLTSLREALPNLDTVAPHSTELISALWLRSLAVGNLAGAEPRTLQIDLTRDRALDDNAFQVELSTVVESSFNIHQVGDRLLFREEENPQAKLMAFAKNDRLFTDGSDRRELSREVRYIIGGTEDVARNFRVIVLPSTWQSDPWTSLDEGERPERWDDRLPVLIMPDTPDRLDERLGTFLKGHVPRRRNTIRFLLPRSGSPSLYFDRDLIVLARAILKAKEWSQQSPEYGRLHKKYEKDLHTALKQRFDRFAVLRTWNFTDPSQCRFQIEPLSAQGNQIPTAIEERLRDDVFVPEDFEAAVLVAAQNNDPVGKLLRELQEPRPNQIDCIPWLGEPLMKDKLLRLCARGKIAINLRGVDYLQAEAGEDEEIAWRRMRGRLGTGRHLDETHLLSPDAVPEAHRVGSGTEIELSPPLSVPSPTFGTPDGGPSAGSAPVNQADHGGTSGALPLRSILVAPATSALNLLGKIEEWNIQTATPVHEVTLKLGSLTGAQLQKLLRNLPDGIKYELSLQKEAS